MKRELVEEVIACLGEHRRVFYYFKDCHCFTLIDLEMARMCLERISIAQLKAGKFARFLNKPSVSQALGAFGNGELDRRSIPLLGPAEQTAFTVTLDTWGTGDRGWDQTSRNQCNLVLQVNFDAGHTRVYEQLIRPLAYETPFEYQSHPISYAQRKTLAWVRMDIDFDTDEVLIEEVQSDWIRKARAQLTRIEGRLANKPALRFSDVCKTMNCDLQALRQYVEIELKPYAAIWSQAAMVAALRFIRDELGISNIYYHTHETGAKLKHVTGLPPRSIYSKLPQEFGFELTDRVPVMLANHPYS